MFSFSFSLLNLYWLGEGEDEENNELEFVLLNVKFWSSDIGLPFTSLLCTLFFLNVPILFHHFLSVDAQFMYETSEDDILTTSNALYGNCYRKKPRTRSRELLLAIISLKNFRNCCFFLVTKERRAWGKGREVRRRRGKD